MRRELTSAASTSPQHPLMTSKGNITVTTALVLPVIMFLFFAFVDIFVYGLGMVELSFSTSQLAVWYQQGETLLALSSQSLMGFSALCTQPDGSAGHNVAVETVLYNGVSFEVFRVQCNWEFMFLDKLWPDLAFPTQFSYQVVLGSV